MKSTVLCMPIREKRLSEDPRTVRPSCTLVYSEDIFNNATAVLLGRHQLLRTVKGLGSYLINQTPGGPLVRALHARAAPYHHRILHRESESLWS